jgi:PAS domain S-box-containing protein
MLNNQASYKNKGTTDPLLHVDQFIVVLNDIIADGEQAALTKIKLDEYIINVVAIFDEYQFEMHKLINELSNKSNTAIEHYRVMSWLIVVISVFMIIAISMSFYRVVTGLLRTQVDLLEQNAGLLKRDLITRKRSEEKISEQAAEMLAERNRMEAVLESAVDAIITISADGTIQSFNRAAEKMFGYYAQKIIGRNVNLLMPEPHHSDHDGYIQNYIRTGEAKVIGRNRILQARRVDGSLFPIELTVTEIAGVQPRAFTGLVRDITEWVKNDKKLRQTMDDLRESQAMLAEEAKFAAQVFENITKAGKHTIPGMSTWSQPMGVFSGDLILSTFLPSGAKRVLLCDFTGHGLPAALGAVPTSTIHNAMAGKDLPLVALMVELNNKLSELLPTGIFCCIVGIDISEDGKSAKIWNSGIPDVLVVSGDGKLKHRSKSMHLPLGVMTYEDEEIQVDEISLEVNDAIYVYSDGITECENEAGQIYGQDEFEALLTQPDTGIGRLEMVKNHMIVYMTHAEPSDDISLIELKRTNTPD